MSQSVHAVERGRGGGALLGLFGVGPESDPRPLYRRLYASLRDAIATRLRSLMPIRRGVSCDMPAVLTREELEGRVRELEAALARREEAGEELASLLRISQALSSTLDLATVFQTTTDVATQLLGIDSAAVYRLEGDRLYLGATTPPLPPGFPESMRSTTLAEHPRIRRCVSSGAAVVLDDARAEALSASERAIVDARGLRTILYIPIRVGKRATGVLILGTIGEARSLSRSEIDLALTAANLIAVSIENATLHANELRQAESLRVENQTNQALTDLSAALVRTGSSLRSIAHVVLEKAKLLTGSEQGYVASIDPQTRDFVAQTFTAGLGEACRLSDANPVLPIGADGRYGGLWGHSLNTRQGFYTNSPHTHESSMGRPESGVPFESFLSVPAIIGGRLVGQIALASCPRGYSQQSLELVERLAELLALAIERFRGETALREAETMTALGSLVGSVAHEVRNPLFALGATVDALELRGGDREDLGDGLSRLRRPIERISQLMGGLLEYGRPHEPILEPVCLLSVIRQAVDDCRRDAEGQGVAIRLRLPESLPAVAADASRLPRALQNVILNAVQHSSAEGVVEVEATGADPREDVVCTICDSGPGFPEGALEKAFEPFYTRRRGGTGLGLAIVQKIVAEHGGTVTLGNAPEGGARVVIRLPRADTARPGAGPSPV